MGELSIAFDYEGEVHASGNGETILERVAGRALHRRVLGAAHQEGQGRAQGITLQVLRRAALDRAFFGFDPDFFQQKLLYMVDEVISQFKGSLEIWPTLVEVCYLRKHRAELPKLVNKTAHWALARTPAYPGT